MAGSRLPRGWRAVGIPLVALAVLVCAGAVTIALLAARSAEVTGETPEERVASVCRIARNRPPGARRALARAAADGNPAVRRAAMAGLSHVLEAEDRAVFEKGTRDPDGRVRAIAADTLGLFRDGAAADVLVKLIESDPSEEVRAAAVRGLARCDDPRSIVVLLETADKDNSGNIKLVAMKGLLRKFAGRKADRRDPSDEAGWRDLIQRWKWDERVRNAYAAAGVPLIDRPKDIIGKVWHPERHEYSGHHHDKRKE